MTKFLLGSETFANKSSSILQVLDLSKSFQLVVQDYVRTALMIAVILLEMLEICDSSEIVFNHFVLVFGLTIERLSNLHFIPGEL